MQADEAFTELLVDQGIDALKAGNKDRAYELLVQAIQNHQHNERAWLWLSGSVADPAERRYCLEWVLAMNPQNSAAQKGLAKLPPDVQPLSPLPEDRAQRTAPTPPPAATPTPPPAATPTPPPAATPTPPPAATPTPPPPASEEASRAQGRRVSLEDLAGQHTSEEEAPRAQGRRMSRETLQTQDTAGSRSRLAGLAPTGERSESADWLSSMRDEDATADSFRAPNPWFAIWLHPRETMRQVAGADGATAVLLLAALAGIHDGLGMAFAASLMLQGIYWPGVIAALVIGAVYGIVHMYVWGFVLRWTGRWFGGAATQAETRAAVAWSAVPRIAGIVLFVPLFVVLGMGSGAAASPALPLVMGVVGLLLTVLALWSFVLFLGALAEMHSFSALKALVATVIGYGMIAVPLAIVGALLSFVVGALIGLPPSAPM